MTQRLPEVTPLLWADDDALDLLDSFARRLERSRFQVFRAVDYDSAIEQLGRESGIHSLLLDVILPKKQGSGSLAYDLGMTLAENAAKTMGVKSIAFLTVVREDDVFEKYRKLRDTFTSVHFEYFDKTQLLERAVFEKLKGSLTANDR